MASCFYPNARLVYNLFALASLIFSAQATVVSTIASNSWQESEYVFCFPKCQTISTVESLHQNYKKTKTNIILTCLYSICSFLARL